MASLFTTISPAAARLQTLVHRHGRGIVFEAGGRRWTAGPAADVPAAHGAALYATLGDGEFTLWLNEPDWRTAAAAVLETPPETVADLPEPLARAALECFAADALDALEKATGLPAALTRLERGAATPVRPACFFELRRDDGLRLGCAWSAPERGGAWRGAVEKALIARAVPGMELPDDLPIAAVIALGVWTMPAADAAALAVGDVALSPAGPERVATVGGALRFAARLEKGVLAVEGETMTNTSPAPETPAAVDNIEVEMQAQVGRIVMTLAQVRRLGAGQIVEFSTPVESPATLLANGKPVATGELVDVGGRVGVRITALTEH